MLTRLYNIENLIIIILALLVALLITAIGKGGGKLLIQLLGKLIGYEGGKVNINHGEEMPGKYNGPVCLVDPAKCPQHEAEHQRSITNEANIQRLFDCVSEVKKEVRDGNERILLALVAGGHIKPEHIPLKK